MKKKNNEQTKNVLPLPGSGLQGTDTGKLSCDFVYTNGRRRCRRQARDPDLRKWAPAMRRVLPRGSWGAIVKAKTFALVRHVEKLEVAVVC